MTDPFSTYECTESVISRLCFLHQTAEIILRNNTHCSGIEMVLDPLLSERVRPEGFMVLPNIMALHTAL